LLIENKIVVIKSEKIPYLKNFVLSLINYVDNLDIQDFKTTFIDRVDTSEMPFVTSSKFLLILRGLSIVEGISKKLDPSFNYRDVIEKYIDFQYMEKKAMMDIDNMRTMPDKVTQNQINIEIVQKNMQRMEERVQPQNIKLVIAMTSMLMFDAVDSAIIKSALAALTTFVILYK
jgi:predicted unusual protein kinase regulating ubiquinone biosynthesis (AarF/ABC1/UbiB family)